MIDFLHLSFDGQFKRIHDLNFSAILCPQERSKHCDRLNTSIMLIILKTYRMETWNWFAVSVLLDAQKYLESVEGV